MTSTGSTWAPPSGRHTVNLGMSLTRALKARQGKGEAQPAKAIRGRDFYSFRYNFKPGQVDSAGRGKITLRKPTETSLVPLTVEHASTRQGEMCVFNGDQMPAKEVDCVLIFDETTGTFTLEKLDSIVKLSYSRKYMPDGESNPASAPVPNTTSVPEPMNVDLADELEQQLINTAEESDGEIDQELFEEIIPSSISRKNERPPPRAVPEEEEEDDDDDIPMAITTKLNKPPVPLPTAKPAKSVKATPKSGPKATPKSAASATPRPGASKSKHTPAQPTPPVAAAAPIPTPAPARSKPVSRPTKKKREAEPIPTPPVSSHMADEEVFNISSKPAKRQRTSPPPKSGSGGLALPGTTSVSRPPPVIPISAAAPPPPVAAELPDSEEDNDSDWDEVAAVDPIPAGPAATQSSAAEDDFDIFGDAMNEDDDGEGEGEEELSDELNQALGLHTETRRPEIYMEVDEGEDVEDFLEGMVEEAPPSAVIPQRESFGGPISLNQFVGGDESEEYSSDESDEEE